MVVGSKKGYELQTVNQKFKNVFERQSIARIMMSWRQLIMDPNDASGFIMLIFIVNLILIMAKKHHSRVMKFVITDKSSISCKTGVVLIIDSISTNIIVALIGIGLETSGFIVTSIRKKLMANEPIFSNPEASINMLFFHIIPDDMYEY